MPTTSGVPRPNTRAGARRPQPISTRFELVPHQGGVTRRFLAYSSPSRSPNPNHLAVLARPGFVRAAPALPGTTRIRLPSAPPSCCDRISDVGLSPPFESLRFTAHARAAAHLRHRAGQRRGQRVHPDEAGLATNRWRHRNAMSSAPHAKPAPPPRKTRSTTSSAIAAISRKSLMATATSNTCRGVSGVAVRRFFAANCARTGNGECSRGASWRNGRRS